MKIWHSSGAAKVVVGMNVGEAVKSALYCGPVKIWPDNSTRYKSMVLDLPDEAATKRWGTGWEDYIYWQHVRYQQEFGLGWEAGRTVTVKLGATTYNLWNKDQPRPRGTMTATKIGANVTFADGEGPLVGEVRAGDEVSLTVTLPVLQLKDFGKGLVMPQQNTSTTVMLPYVLLKDTKFQYDWWKGQKLVNSKVRFEITHYPELVTFVNAEGETYGKWTGYLSVLNYGTTYGDRIFGAGDYRIADKRTESWMNDAWTQSTGMQIYSKSSNSASNVSLYPIFPAFTRTIKFKVKSLML